MKPLIFAVSGMTAFAAPAAAQERCIEPIRPEAAYLLDSGFTGAEVRVEFLRAALARLREDGIVQSRRGSGSYVVRRPDRLVGSFVPLGSISDIQRCYEFRIDLEGAATGWAARRRSEADLQEIDAAMRDLEGRYQEQELATEADQRFHLAVARASHNPFFVSMLESLRDQIAFGVNLSRSLTMMDQPSRQETVLAEHRAILAALRDGNSQAAEAAMRTHITLAKNRMFVGKLSGADQS